jgi:hypothetical protein
LPTLNCNIHVLMSGTCTSCACNTCPQPTHSANFESPAISQDCVCYALLKLNLLACWANRNIIMLCPSCAPACSCWFSQTSKTVSLFYLLFSGFTFGFDEINFLNSNLFAVQSVYSEAFNCCLQFISERPVRVLQFSFSSCWVKYFVQPCCKFTFMSVWYYHRSVSNVCRDTTVFKWWAVASRQFLPLLTN